MALLTPDYDMVTKVTIIPRSSGAGGFTLFTPSEATEVAIDAEVQKIVQRAYKKCFQTLSDNKELLIEFCDQLIEKETMDYKELQAMMESNAERRAALPAQ